MLARLLREPVGFVIPATAETEFFVLEARDVFTDPLVTAEARSTTRIVTMSSTWLARQSLTASLKTDVPDHSEPAEGAGISAALPRACST
jgi:hypothetical protein